MLTFNPKVKVALLLSGCILIVLPQIFLAQFLGPANILYDIIVIAISIFVYRVNIGLYAAIFFALIASVFLFFPPVPNYACIDGVKISFCPDLFEAQLQSKNFDFSSILYYIYHLAGEFLLLISSARERRGVDG